MFGDIKVTLQKEERLTNYCIRQLFVEKVCFGSVILEKLIVQNWITS